MYKNFFQLERLPFSISPDPAFLFKMPQTLEALACLKYGLANARGFIVLTGEVGTGKTTLLNRASEELGSKAFQTSFLFNPRLDTLEFLEFVLHDFGIVPVNRTKSGMLMQLNQWLIHKYQQGQTCALIVDEAQNLSLDLLEEIRLLTNLETSSQKLLQIVLSGQPEFETRLLQPSLRQLRQRVAVWCRTYALDEAEVTDYIRERLAIAGAKKEIFSAEAAHLIYKYSQGIPRTINVICEHALIYSYAQDSAVVPPEVIDAVAQDLGLAQKQHHYKNAAIESHAREQDVVNEELM